MLDPSTDLNFHLRLAQCMSDAEMKKEEVARMISVSETTMANWLRGKTFPRWQSIRKLAQLFGVSYWWLRTGTGENNV